MSDTATVLKMPAKSKSKQVIPIFKSLSKINHKKKVKIRYKPIGKRDSKKRVTKATGYTIYFDIWQNGKHEYLFKNIYIKGLQNTKIEDENRLKIAIRIREKLEEQFERDGVGFEMPSRKQEENFILFFENLARKKKLNTWDSVYLHLNEFTGGKILFKSINYKFCEAFKEYLLSKVASNTAHTYFLNFKVSLNQAVKENYLSKNPAGNLRIRKVDPEREFLTESEIQSLINTPYHKSDIRNSFLFAIFTGLRFSDIKRLSFKDIQDGYVTFRQKKTQEVERFKLNENALNIIKTQKHGKRGKDLVFKLPDPKHINHSLREWSKEAGIKKYISFHVGRHSFATMCLTHDIDIFIVQKLLGHKKLETTKIYAKLIDKKKDEAIDKLPTFEL